MLCFRYALNLEGARCRSAPAIAGPVRHIYLPPLEQGGICRDATLGWGGDGGAECVAEFAYALDCLAQFDMHSSKEPSTYCS